MSSSDIISSSIILSSDIISSSIIMSFIIISSIIIMSSADWTTQKTGVIGEGYMDVSETFKMRTMKRCPPSGLGLTSLVKVTRTSSSAVG